MAIAPRTVIWRTAGDPPGPINREVVTALGQQLSPTAAGAYEVDVGDGTWRSLTIQQGVQVTRVTRQYSRAVGGLAIDLNTLGPAPVGTPVYTDGAGFPSNGVVRTDNILSIDVEAASDGIYVVRRSDDSGLRDLEFDFRGIANTWEIVGSDLFITAGANDPDNTLYSLTPTDGPFADQTAQWTWGDVPALNPSGATPGLTIFEPTVAIQSGGQNGQATTGTVLVRTPGLRAYRATATPAPVTVEWRSGATVLSGTGLTYTVGAEAGPFTVRETDGGPSVGTSNAIERVAAVAGVTPTLAVPLAIQSGPNNNTLPPVSRSVDLSALPVGRELLILTHFITNGSSGGVGTMTLGGVDVPPLTINSKLARTPDGYFIGTVWRRVARPDVGGGVMDLLIGASNSLDSTSKICTAIFAVTGRQSDIDTVESRTNGGASQTINIPTGASGAMLIGSASNADAPGSYTSGVTTQWEAGDGSHTFHAGVAAPTADETREAVFTCGANPGRTTTVAISLGA